MWFDFVEHYPVLSAMCQFVVLGTLGEWFGTAVRKRGFVAFPPLMILEKMAIWAILGVMIKYVFVGFEGFVDTLMKEGMLPNLYRPFFISSFMNLLFGPVQITSHRVMDNLFKEVKSWKGLRGALFTILWFWIPAHTITFMMPRVWQMTLAAFWSGMLGVIMGFFNRKKRPS